MKRVKIMLTAITVVAIVSGSLAFKALKFDGKLYCTAPAGSTKCPTPITGISTTTSQTETQVAFTIVQDLDDCNSNLNCQNDIFLTSGD